MTEQHKYLTFSAPLRLCARNQLTNLGSIRVPGRKIVREGILKTRQGRCLRRVAETEAKDLRKGCQTQAKALPAADETTWRIHARGDAMRLKLAAFGSDPVRVKFGGCQLCGEV